MKKKAKLQIENSFRCDLISTHSVLDLIYPQPKKSKEIHAMNIENIPKCFVQSTSTDVFTSILVPVELSVLFSFTQKSYIFTKRMINSIFLYVRFSISVNFPLD